MEKVPTTAEQASEPAFGQRFLDEFVRLGGQLSVFKYAEIQVLRSGGREEMVALLRREYPLSVTYEHLQRIRQANSPEELAQEFVRRQTAAAQASSVVMLIGLAGFLSN